MNRTILEKMFSFPKNLKILVNDETQQTFSLNKKVLQNYGVFRLLIQQLLNSL